MNTYFKGFLSKLYDYTFHIFYNNIFLTKKHIEDFQTFFLHL